MPPASSIPYCGAPPAPESLWARWNFDPVLLVALGAIYCLYLWSWRENRSERINFTSGWAIAAVALVSPLCAFSVSLFAARVGQHMVLTLVAAPLVALGLGNLRIPPILTRIWQQRPRSGAPAAGLVYAIFLWLWHMPGPYAATFQSTALYWVMHVTLFGSALWLWACLLNAQAHTGDWLRLTVGFASSMQMGLLGAVITLAPQLLYEPHVFTTSSWGLTPLEDQQLGGLIMWVPGGLAFFAVGLYQMAQLIAERRQADKQA